MLKYILRRILQFIPVFFGVTLALFLIANYMPGADPIQMRMGEKSISPTLKAKLRHQYGLDRPWYVQYADYLSDLSPMHMVMYDPSDEPADEKVREQVGKALGFIPVVQGSAPSDGLLDIHDPIKANRGKKHYPGDGCVDTYTRGSWGRLALGSASFELDPPDLGTSIYRGRPVLTIFAETYPYTIRLAFVAIMIEIIVGIGVGIISAIKRYSIWDLLVTLSTSILVSLPVFWLGLLLQWCFGIWLKRMTGDTFYLPISGASGPLFSDWVYLILPGITLASVSTAYAARIMRSQLLEVNGQDYIRTAHAKGLSGRQVLFGHAMKNALIPVVTFIGLDLGAMFAGAVLTETVFNWPGVGFTIARAIFQRDFPVVFGGVTVILFAVMAVNLLVDISYAFLDPRIRYGGSED